MNEGEYLILVNELRDQYNAMKEKYEIELLRHADFDGREEKEAYSCKNKMFFILFSLVLFLKKDEYGFFLKLDEKVPILFLLWLFYRLRL